MMHSIKDAMTAKAAQVYVNSQIARYGELTSLKLDSRQKSIELTGRLLGDDEPVEVTISRYALEKVGDKIFISVKDFTCSRPWLQNLLEDFIRDHRAELPGWAAGAL